MNNVLYKDSPTKYRVLIDGRKRVVYARYDWEGQFVRFVVHKTKLEIEKTRKKYLPTKVGICSWFQVWEYNFA